VYGVQRLTKLVSSYDVTAKIRKGTRGVPQRDPIQGWVNVLNPFSGADALYLQVDCVLPYARGPTQSYARMGEPSQPNAETPGVLLTYSASPLIRNIWNDFVTESFGPKGRKEDMK
jgi:hypothetical protein